MYRFTGHTDGAFPQDLIDDAAGNIYGATGGSYMLGNGVVRMTHAHNALVRFRDKPFTQEEFQESVRAVLNGENSRLIT